MAREFREKERGNTGTLRRKKQGLLDHVVCMTHHVSRSHSCLHVLSLSLYLCTIRSMDVDQTFSFLCVFPSSLINRFVPMLTMWTPTTTQTRRQSRPAALSRFRWWASSQSSLRRTSARFATHTHTHTLYIYIYLNISLIYGTKLLSMLMFCSVLRLDDLCG